MNLAIHFHIPEICKIVFEIWCVKYVAHKKLLCLHGAQLLIRILCKDGPFQEKQKLMDFKDIFFYRHNTNL